MKLTCTDCKQTKSTDEFYTNRSRKTGYQQDCKDCRKKTNAIWRSNNKEFIKSRNKDWWMKHKYGMLEADYNLMCLNQSNKCAVCFDETRLVVDHCHTTGKVRALLCDRCNHALGHARESKQILQNLIQYIERYNT